MGGEVDVLWVEKEFEGKIEIWGQEGHSGVNMAVITVDRRGRMTIPKELDVRGTRAVIIPAGSFFIFVPVPHEPIEVSGGWLKTKLDRRALKAMAEKAARRDAVERARRRRQL